MNIRKLTLLAALLVPAAFPQKRPVTLDDVDKFASRPYPAPVWAPDGSQYAFESGGRLHLYEVSRRAARELASLAPLNAAATKGPSEGPFQWENRRVREARLQWTPDGTRLVILASGDLFLMEVPSGQWRQLTATAAAERGPKVSPDGKSVAFRRGNELYLLDIASRKERRLTHDATDTLWNGRLDWVYPEELDLGDAYWWSPDSKALAYLQFDVSRQMIYPHGDLQPVAPVFEPQRYPKAGTPNADVRLGVVPAAGGTTRWMDLGETREHLIGRVSWRPDSKALLAQRLNRVQNRLDLLSVDPDSGAARLLLRESDPYWVNLSSDLRLFKDSRRFLWSSERSGFRHLYLYTMDGKLERQITSGNWEVSEVVCLEESHAAVYYVSTEASPLERRLYRAALDGKGRRIVTPEPGVHRVSMSPGCRHVIDAYSSFSEPTRRVLRHQDGSVIAELEAPDRRPLEELDLLPVEILPVKAPDGETLYARLIRPANFDKYKKYPAIVMVYGGPHSQAVQNSWRGVSLEQVLAHRGFVVWQLDNRGSAGRGHAWEAKLFRRFGKQELEDQKTGVGHLVAMGFVDPNRIGIHGWSYGGFMTLYALLHAPDMFRAGVAGAPVTDWRNYDTIYTERYLGLPSENPEGYRESSPVHFAANLKGRLMLIHNYQDDNVLFQNTFQMMVALQRANKAFDLMIYPQKTHGVTGQAQRHMRETILAFFERELR